jgi:hypothetical protein
MMAFYLTSVQNNPERLGASKATVYGFAHEEAPLEMFVSNLELIPPLLL